MNTISLSVKCFGVFRKFGESLNVDIAEGSSVLEVKQALIQKLGQTQKALVEDSVLANDNEILPNAYILKDETALSILPPVCGG
ncbi:MAG: MoaD/ThiS family protein [Rhodospirillales bacterium]|nr:MoaD/ThiS family protein [Alphaproteobacteria bacterium]USO06465.1 MAG: MoaD/ThiS family protein [Rhodospirillales bacterium]